MFCDSYILYATHHLNFTPNASYRMQVKHRFSGILIGFVHMVSMFHFIPNSAIISDHPFDPDTNYLSSYPFGFQGCYVCGSTAHQLSKDGPAVQSYY